MQQNKTPLTLTDLTTIFHVSKSSIRSHLEQNHLSSKLLKSGDMVKDNYKYTFSNHALLEIAYTFKGKISNRKSKVDNNGISKSNVKHISKSLDGVNSKIDMIMNHLHINY